MKSKLFLTISILAAGLIFSSWTFSVMDNKESLLIRLMMQGLSQNHYKEVTIDDQFSREAFDMYLKRLDFNKRYFVQEDINKMSQFQADIDDEVNNGTYQLLDLSVMLITERINEAKGYVDEILAKPFDFTKKEEINLDMEEADYAKNKAALKERWRKLLKYQTMVRLDGLLSDQEKKAEKSEDGSTSEVKSVEELEQQARERVAKNYENTFSYLTKLDREDWRTRYINAITSTYDPHTTFFPPKEKEEFDIDMAGQFEGIGARLTEQANGYIKIVEIIPGGPSSKQEKLKAEDLILKVGQGDEEPVDVVDMRMDDAIRLIRGKKGTEVRLTVRHPDGSEEVIPIIRDVVKIEETYAKSLLMQEDESKIKVGYIHLPKFYTDFRNRSGRTCSKDVEIEIEKLKQEGATHMILDLRNNGGGSLNDVIDMAGLFIEEGPIVQVKGRNGEPYIYRDKDPRVQFDGPLVILVNSRSASASEILAAAMQDYKRAIIIGSSSTYGKGTVQTIFDLDRYLGQYPELRPMGAMKLTIQKFYRVNGGATQHKGVTPDIILPDTYSYLDLGESQNEHSMPWDEIAPVEYKPWVQSGVYLKKAIDNSKKRVAKNEIFQLLDENAVRYKKLSDIDDYSLNLESYRKQREAQQEEADKYKDLFQAHTNLKIENPQVDIADIQAEESRVETNEKWKKQINKDPYVYEAIQVLKDLK